MNKQDAFFQVHPPSERDYEPYGVAYFPEGTPVIDIIPSSFGWVEKWPGYELLLKDGAYTDALANNRAARIFSAPLQEFLTARASPEDVLQWLPVTVRHGSEVRPYYVLNFPVDFKVLNRAETKWIVTGTREYPRVPVIRQELFGKREIFALGNVGYSFFVSKEIRRALGKRFPKRFSFRPIAMK